MGDISAGLFFAAIGLAIVVPIWLLVEFFLWFAERGGSQTRTWFKMASYTANAAFIAVPAIIGSSFMLGGAAWLISLTGLKYLHAEIAVLTAFVLIIVLCVSAWMYLINRYPTLAAKRKTVARPLAILVAILAVVVVLMVALS